MSINSDIKKLFKELKRKGWSIEQGRKHYMLKHPLGGFVSCSVSPSCPWAIQHIEADIRKLERKNEAKARENQASA